MAKYIGTVVAKELNVRNVPDAKHNVPIGKLKLGTKIEADRLEGNWWHIVKVNNVDVLDMCWAFAGEKGGYIRLDKFEPDLEETIPVQNIVTWMSRAERFFSAVYRFMRAHGYDGEPF